MLKHYIFLLLFILANLSAQQLSSGADLPKIKSSITMPVRIPLSEISNAVNASVTSLIYEDQSYTDNNNDQFKVKVWKAKPIRLIGGKNQNIIIEVPLKIWAQKGVGTLGVYSYQETTFETVMFFSSSILFQNNWTVKTDTKPMGFQWVTKPVLDYGQIKIPITPLVEKQLRTQQAEFSALIDKKMETQLDFRKYAVMAWNVFANPFQVSEEYNTWLKITPLSVNMAPLKFYADVIDTTLGIDTYSETFTGLKPASDLPIKTVTNFNYVQNLPDKFILQTTANIPYTEATSIGRNLFLNKEFDFNEGKAKVKISDIQVFKKDNSIAIEIKTEGAANGTSLVTGVPTYDPLKRRIVLTETNFTLKTKNIFHKTATVLFKGKIIKMIEEEYGIPTAEIEDASRKSVEATFNTEYYKGLKMSGKVTKLIPSTILLNDSGFTVVIDTQAKLNLLIKGF